MRCEGSRSAGASAVVCSGINAHLNDCSIMTTIDNKFTFKHLAREKTASCSSPRTRTTQSSARRKTSRSMVWWWAWCGSTNSGERRSCGRIGRWRIVSGIGIGIEAELNPILATGSEDRQSVPRLAVQQKKL